MVGSGAERRGAARRSRRRTRQFRSCSPPDGVSPGLGRHPLKLRIHTARGRRDAVGRCSSPTGRLAGPQIRVFAGFSQWRGLYAHSGPLAEARDDASAEILDWAVGPHRYKRDQLTSLAAIPQLQTPCATGRSWRTTHVRPKRPPSPHGRCRRRQQQRSAASVAPFDGRRSSWRRTIASIAVTVLSQLALRRRYVGAAFASSLLAWTTASVGAAGSRSPGGEPVARSTSRSFKLLISLIYFCAAAFTSTLPFTPNGQESPIYARLQIDRPRDGSAAGSLRARPRRHD
jgi:hypothetical protein